MGNLRISSIEYETVMFCMTEQENPSEHQHTIAICHMQAASGIWNSLMHCNGCMYYLSQCVCVFVCACLCVCYLELLAKSNWQSQTFARMWATYISLGFKLLLYDALIQKLKSLILIHVINEIENTALLWSFLYLHHRNAFWSTVSPNCLNSSTCQDSKAHNWSCDITCQ